MVTGEGVGRVGWAGRISTMTTLEMPLPGTLKLRVTSRESQEGQRHPAGAGERMGDSAPDRPVCKSLFHHLPTGDLGPAL